MELKGTVEIEETYYKRSLELAFTDYLEEDTRTPKLFRDCIIDRLIEDFGFLDFWINPRNCKEVQYEIIREALEAIELGTHKLFKCVSRALGRKRCNKYKSKWILDFDTKDWSLINKYLDLVRKCRPNVNKILYYVPTVNGIHVITLGFDLEQFKQELAIAKLDNIDIHKDNPTILYYSNE